MGYLILGFILLIVVTYKLATKYYKAHPTIVKESKNMETKELVKVGFLMWLMMMIFPS